MAWQEIEKNWELRRFFTVQVNRYLCSKSKQCFSEASEFDAIMCMIRDTWVELNFSTKLNELCRKEREHLYQNVIIVFPDFVVDTPCHLVPVDFVNSRNIAASYLNNYGKNQNVSQKDTL